MGLTHGGVLSPGWCQTGPDRSMNGLRGQQALWRTNWQNNNPREKRKCLYSEIETWEGGKIASKMNEESNLLMEREYGFPAPSSEAVGYTTFLAPPQFCLGLWLESREIQGEVWVPLHPPLCHSTTNYKLALAIYLCKDSIRCCCSWWPSAPPEGSSGRRAEMRHSVLWKNWQNRPPEREIFRSWFYEPNSWIPSYLEKHLIPSWWHLLLRTSRKPSAKKKKKCFIACTSPLPKSHIHWASPRPLWSSFSRAT